MNRHLIAATVALSGLGAFLAGCQPAPAPTAVPATAVPTAAAAAPAAPVEPSGPPLGAASVKAMRGDVAVGDATLAVDAETPLASEASLAVPERGMAVVQWAEGARVEALGTTLTLAPADGKRQVAVHQATGTARYTTPANAPDGAIGLAIDTERAFVHATGPADVIVSQDPASAAGTLWVIVIDGAVEIAAGAPVASAAGAASSTTPLKATVDAGQVIAVRTSGGQPSAVPVDLTTIETWYGGLVAGDGSPLASMAAYRCVVTADGTPLLEQPAAKAAVVAQTAPLTTGTLIDVRGRTPDSAWLQVYFTANELSGWVPASTLQCIAPAEALAVVDPATIHNVDRASLAVDAPVVISFVADKTEIASGACAKLNWDVAAGRSVTLEGQPVPGKGFKLMCPPVSSTYTLSWVDESGKPQSRRVTVTVAAALASADVGAGAGGGTGGDTGGDTGGSARVGPSGGGAEAVPTVCVGPECEVVIPTPPPTATRRARPTEAPPAAATDAPPPPPAATDAPPPAAPTDRAADPTKTPTLEPATPTSPPAAPTDPPAETPAPTDPPAGPTDTPEPPLTPIATPTPTPTP
ncbi:MAG: hypothetical protein ABI780_08230 [Ardenticatenales bacterium]